jgi:hypothetical protein
MRAAMKKHAVKKKGAAKRKPRAAKATSRKTTYTPPPLKSDGWPPFRYPLT